MKLRKRTETSGDVNADEKQNVCKEDKMNNHLLNYKLSPSIFSLENSFSYGHCGAIFVDSPAHKTLRRQTSVLWNINETVVKYFKRNVWEVLTGSENRKH